MIGFDLLLITDPSIDGWLDAVCAAIEAAPPGRLAVQARDPRAGAAELAELTRNLLVVARGRAPVIVNDRADVASVVGADGVHLKESGLEVRDARALLGPRAIIGASCHDEAGVRRRSDADYLVLGPYAATPGKGVPLGTQKLAQLAQFAHPPILALGGIDASNAENAVRAGAHGIAVIRAVQAAKDPAATTMELLAALERAR